jgi:tripartite-type tricarboxylate transporter receptor subunit TctC
MQGNEKAPNGDLERPDAVEVSACSRRRFLLAGAAASAAIPLVRSRPARSASNYPLLKGRTITILVGSDVGGNFDLFARSIGRHFEREISGLRVEVKNVPQASGALAARTLQEGPTDGTMLFTSSSGLLGAQVQGDESVAYDLSKWSWLGRLATEARVVVRGPGADFASFEELRAKTAPSSMSVRSKTSFAYHEALWLNAMLGLRIKPVPGFKAIEKEVALVQGEVMLTVVGYPTEASMFPQPGVDVVLRLTEGAALPDRFAHRPLLADLIAGRPEMTGIARFMKASTSLQNWMAAPPGTSPEVLSEWRRAFDAAATSPAYLEESRKLGFEVSLLTGTGLARQLDEIFSDLPSLRAQLDAAYRCGSDLAEGKAPSCAFL